MPEEKVLPVRVAIRSRPLIAKEINEGCQRCLTFTSGEPQVILGNNKAFTYDYAFDATTPQVQVYDQAVKGLVSGIFKGYNATVLAYGQTGSGKTFSMGGAYDSGNDETVKGIIPRVIVDIFEGIERRKERDDFTVKVSYLEIYNEELLDLLVPAANRQNNAVAIREGTHGGIRLTGLKEKPVHTTREMLNCLEVGALGRTTGATAMNSTSSRSHAIFTIHVDRKNKTDSNDFFTAKFHLVDLAGSERQKKTNAEGERFKEGVNINLGLLALGNVISALGEENSKRHVPYRESKLTRLLQDSLGGNSNTVMVACVSPADSNYEETLSTLRYADRARKIKNKPIVNRDPQSAEIMRLKAEVKDLQKQLVGRGGSTASQSSGNQSADSSRSSLDTSTDYALLKEVVSKLEEENGKLRMELVNAIHQNTSMCEKMVTLEAINDRLRESTNKLKEKTGLSLSMIESNPEMQEKIREIQEEVKEMETIHESCLEDQESTGDAEQPQEEPSERKSSDAHYTTEDVLKEARLKNKMYELNDQLAQKEALLKEINSNNTTFSVFHDKFEAELKERECTITDLQREKEELTDQLTSAKAALNTSKVGEQRRKRVIELEKKITAIQRQNKEQGKLLKMREATAKESQRLKSEIGELKKCRVTLMKQMRSESEASRKWKQKKEKEVMQLKAKERKQKAEFTKMERAHSQQQQVLRRKVDEASAANRRLRDALDKQKKAIADRQVKQERHNTHNQAKMTKWLNDEFDLLVSVEENRHHLTQMLNQRKDLASRLTSLKDELQQPPTKRKMLNATTSEETDEHKAALEAKRKEVARDLKDLNEQITETQQRIGEADPDEKSKSRWDDIRTLMEARCALSLLLDKAVKAQVECLEETSKAVEAAASLEERDNQVAGLEAKVLALKEHHNKQVTILHQESERRMAPLLQMLNQKALTQDDADKMVQLNKDGLERLAVLSDDLAQQSEEIDTINRKLVTTALLEKQGHTSFFGHLDSTPVLDEPAMRRIKKPKQVAATPLVDYDCFSPEPPTPQTAHDPDWSPSTYDVPKGKISTRRPGRSSEMRVPTFSISDSDLDPENPPTCKCACKGSCSTKRCRCFKNEKRCGDHCLCQIPACINKGSPDENASAANTTFIKDDTTLEPEEEPKKRSGVKRNSSGQPLIEKKQLSSIFPDSDNSLNSTDDFTDTTFSNRRRTRRPFFDAPTPPM